MILKIAALVCIVFAIFAVNGCSSTHKGDGSVMMGGAVSPE